MDNNRILNVVLGALLHDVGKLGQRAFDPGKGLSAESRGLQGQACPTARAGYSTHLHVLYTNEFLLHALSDPPAWIDFAFCANCAVYHHRPNDETERLVQTADHLSAEIDRIDDPESAESAAAGAFRTTRLRSILARVEIGFPRPPQADQLEIPLDEWGGADGLFTLERRTKAAQRDYRWLWDGLVEEMRACRVPEPLGFLDRAVSILQRWTASVPSATNALPDISLFDHLRSTAAIAHCMLADDADATHPFLFVVGDFGGIQNFIYDLHAGRGGLAKRLRGRSTFVRLLTERVALRLLRLTGHSLANRILGGGGAFHLLLPNTPAVHAAIDTVRAETDAWALRETGGDVRLFLAGAPCTTDDIRDFPRAVRLGMEALAVERARPLRTLLHAGGSWDADRLVLRDHAPTPGQRLCQSCRKNHGDPRDDAERGEVVLCSLCEAQSDDGARLAKSQWIDVPLAPPAVPHALRETPPRKPAAGTLYFGLDGIHGADPAIPATAWHLGRHVPTNAAGDLLDFAAIAARSRGDARLGILAADVDNLGFVFSRGLRGRDPSESRASLSRVATLSRTLDGFFSLGLNALIEDEFPDLYLVYSGGDDVVCIGPWDSILRFASRLRDAFREATGDNPNLGLSAGIAVLPPKTPVLQAIEAAHAALDSAKQPRPDHRKDRIAAYGSLPLDWADYRRAIADAFRFADWIDAGVLHRTQVHRLLLYSRLHDEFVRTRDTIHLRYAPMFIRDLRRNWTPGERDEQASEKLAARNWVHPFSVPESPLARTIAFVCTCALTATRSSSQREEA